jgi:hypothetical protein
MSSRAEMDHRPTTEAPHRIPINDISLDTGLSYEARSSHRDNVSPQDNGSGWIVSLNGMVPPPGRLPCLSVRLL